MLALGLGAAPAYAAPQGVTPKIVHGSDASVTQFPFQALLYVAGTEPKSPMSDPSSPGGRFCGGVIMDTTHIITAAHCVFDVFNPGEVSNASEVAVLVGTDDLAPQPDGTNQKEVASKIAFDPLYDPASAVHDVALITLPSPLTQNAWVSPIPLITDSDWQTIAPGDNLTVSGWGDTNPEPPDPDQESPSYPNHLQEADVPLVDGTACTNDYGIYDVPIDTSLLFCAGDHDPGTGIADSCQGDSGGPIVFDTDPNPATHAYVLAGLVDSGIGCAQPMLPGIYTQLANQSLQDFLNSNPHSAPLKAFGPSISGGNQPGQTLRCGPGTWSSDQTPTLQHAFISLPSGTVLAAADSYVIQEKDRGTSILCEEKASNDGGYGYADSVAVSVPAAQAPPPPPPPAAKDTVAPRLRVTSKSCGRTTCTVRVHVTDAAPSSGVARVKAVLNYKRRVKCPSRKSRASKKRTCVRRLHRTLRASAGSVGRFTIVARKLTAGTSYTISLVPYDKAGNRPAFSTITNIRTKAKPRPRRRR